MNLVKTFGSLSAALLALSLAAPAALASEEYPSPTGEVSTAHAHETNGEPSALQAEGYVGTESLNTGSAAGGSLDLGSLGSIDENSSTSEAVVARQIDNWRAQLGARRIGATDPAVDQQLGPSADFLLDFGVRGRGTVEVNTTPFNQVTGNYCNHGPVVTDDVIEAWEPYKEIFANFGARHGIAISENADAYCVVYVIR